MTIIVLGQERTGTHTLSEMFKASGLDSQHESEPSLCREAFSRVTGNTWNPSFVENAIQSYRGRVESNHRLQFFADILAEQLPEAKFIFLTRHPVRIVTSLLGTFAHYPGITAPDWYLQQAKLYIPNNKRDFNLYRLPCTDNVPLPILLLRSWLMGLKFSLPLLANLGERLKIHKTTSINNSRNLWEWLDLPWTVTVAEKASIRTDSIYGLFGVGNIAGWAEAEISKYRSQIKEEFISAVENLPLGEKILMSSL